MINGFITVRKQKLEDNSLIVDYFLNASHEHLLNMGVYPDKVYERAHFMQMLDENYLAEDQEKKLFYIIWELNNEPIGHCNINKIKLNEEAYMHLHLWQNHTRQSGLGFEFLKKTIPIFFKVFGLKRLFCEPYALNPAPNKTLKKIGFDFLLTYEAIPGTFSFHQQVNRWCLTNQELDHLPSDFVF